MLCPWCFVSQLLQKLYHILHLKASTATKWSEQSVMHTLWHNAAGFQETHITSQPLSFAPWQANHHGMVLREQCKCKQALSNAPLNLVSVGSIYVGVSRNSVSHIYIVVSGTHQHKCKVHVTVRGIIFSLTPIWGALFFSWCQSESHILYVLQHSLHCSIFFPWMQGNTLALNTHSILYSKN